jgi:hypothetical protein
MTAALPSFLRHAPVRYARGISAVGRMAGHAQGVQRMNGRLTECTGVEREFREEMLGLLGELMLLENQGDEAMRACLESEIWEHIAGLHCVFGRSDLVDDLVGLLILTREAKIAGDIPGVPLPELRECVGRMAEEKPTPQLSRECSRKLRSAGVDMNRGF